MCDFTKTIYMPEKSRQNMLELLETFPSELKLSRYDFLNLWVELGEKILITVSDQETVADGLTVLLKLFSMRGEAILLSKIIDGAPWVQRPVKHDLDTVFKGEAARCRIKFQAIQKSTSESRTFVVRSRTFDLDEEIESFVANRRPSETREE